ncbi:carotenoid oxygenase family protein [Streptomyces sp. NPDC048270]|uniref:carotenoid oxygenase family protein n=1 Tax=Streptomyces sp. NPDC048270 TaxID=3154615 RepID=UPI0033C900C9
MKSGAAGPWDSGSPTRVGNRRNLDRSSLVLPRGRAGAGVGPVRTAPAERSPPCPWPVPKSASCPRSSPPTRHLGAEHRYQYAVSFPDEKGFGGYGIVKYDRTTGARRIHRAGDARLPGEAVFVPAARATCEDDGYLLTVVSDLKQDASQLLVLDASGLDRIATVHLPHRVSAGVHGSWVPDSALDGAAG